MSISTTGWRGLLAVTATCVFVGACTGDDDDAEDTADTAETADTGDTAGAATTTAGTDTTEATGTATAEDTTAPTTAPEDTGVTVAQTGDRLQAVQEDLIAIRHIQLGFLIVRCRFRNIVTEIKHRPMRGS